MARVALEHVGKKPTDKALTTAAKKMGLKNKDALLARLGSAEMTGSDLVGALYPELLMESTTDDNLPAAEILGLNPGQYAQPGQCCQPLPGERIVGIATRGKGVVFHTIHCKKLALYEDQTNRWMDLHWTKGRSDPVNNVTIQITMANDAGVLGRICTLIGEQNANIADMQFTERKPDFYRMMIEIQVRDVEHLHHVITAVEADSDVADVKRTRARITNSMQQPSKG